MRSLTSLEKELARLRARNTAFFEAQKWVEMHACSRKIIKLLNLITKHFPNWRVSEAKKRTRARPEGDKRASNLNTNEQ